MEEIELNFLFCRTKKTPNYTVVNKPPIFEHFLILYE